MRCTVIFPGRIKDVWVRQGLEHYRTLLEPRIRLELVAVKDEKINDPGSREAALRREGQRLWEKARSCDRRIVLDAGGQHFDSPGLSTRLEQWKQGGASRFAFLVGSAYGLDPSLKSQADLVLSLSDLTLPHQLSLLVLAEQIFRSMKIAAGENYHY